MITELLTKKTIPVPAAKESSYRFWEWCNSKEGLPEHYPDEELIRFLMKSKSKKNPSQIKLLDLGFGSGKNTIPMCELGFDTYGVDWSKSGLNYTQSRLEKANLKACLKQVDYTKEKIPFEDGFFDIIVGIQTFDHLVAQDGEKAFEEAYRVLKPQGLLFTTFMSTQTTKRSRIGIPLEGEKNVFLVSSGNSAGEIHRLFENQEMELFVKRKFEIQSSVTITQTYNATGEQIESKYFTLMKV